MRFLSTRGGPEAGFLDVLLGGPAADGGLFLPDHWPRIKRDEIAAFASQAYEDAAFRVMSPFVDKAFSDKEFKADIAAAYASFSDRTVAPLKEIGSDLYLLELFHGPTLAFKDVAMQLLGRLFSRGLAKKRRRATVVVATSGDTGSAAIAALKGLPNIDVVVMHPKGRVSEVQRRQMTTALDANIHNIALEGTFDDTQAIVKALFADTAFASSISLTAVNSINFARIMAQCVYYFTAAAALGEGRRPSFVVPTGNFGDIFAAEAAWRMGLQIDRLVIATNANDILARALHDGVYGAGASLATMSPSMDIQVASNFERALFEASDRDAIWVKSAMDEFAAQRRLTIAPPVLRNLRELYLAESANDAETIDAIRTLYQRTGIVVDPHSAVGLAAYEKLKDRLSGPVVVLATAHPAKFSVAVTEAIGKQVDLPPHLDGLLRREERCAVLPNRVDAVREFILKRVQAL